MTTCPAGVLALAALLTAGMAHAQDPSEPSASGDTPQTACRVDAHLSAWLSLEAADRIVAALERERRELRQHLAQHGKTLELMDEGKTVAEGVTVTRLGVLTSTGTGGRGAIQDAYDQIETRLTEVDKTLKRRRMQRAKLEQWLEDYLSAGETDGSSGQP